MGNEHKLESTGSHHCSFLHMVNSLNFLYFSFLLHKTGIRYIHTPLGGVKNKKGDICKSLRTRPYMYGISATYLFIILNINFIKYWKPIILKFFITLCHLIELPFLEKYIDHSALTHFKMFIFVLLMVLLLKMIQVGNADYIFEFEIWKILRM